MQHILIELRSGLRRLLGSLVQPQQLRPLLHRVHDRLKEPGVSGRLNRLRLDSGLPTDRPIRPVRFLRSRRLFLEQLPGFEPALPGFQVRRIQDGQFSLPGILDICGQASSFLFLQPRNIPDDRPPGYAKPVGNLLLAHPQPHQLPHTRPAGARQPPPASPRHHYASPPIETPSTGLPGCASTARSTATRAFRHARYTSIAANCCSRTLSTLFAKFSGN